MVFGLMAAVPVAFLSAKYFLNDAHVSAGMVGLWKGWPSLYNSFIFNVFWVSLVIYAVAEFVRRRSFEEWFLPSGLMYLFGSMYFLLMLNFIAVSDRYRLSAYPFLVYGGFYAVAQLVRSDVLRKLGLIVLALVYAFSSFGFFYGNSVDHIVSERSLEYRNDLLVDRALVKEIEDRYSSFKIGAPIILAHILALPELGYVHKKLSVLIYGFPCTYGGIEEFSGLPNLDMKRTVFVSRYKNHPSGSSLVPFPIDEKDLILGKVSVGDRTAWIFMGGFAIEKLFRIVSYLHKYYPDRFSGSDAHGAMNKK
ncbi:MAG TPA: hypothetical protein VLJ10_04645, partial [Candidatus Bathyarchaeia archaeon]|nr:hypothetical protein [Candidatus Bathyarchaeia archaeon]